jgi:hypothetical protein
LKEENKILKSKLEATWADVDTARDKSYEELE